MPKGQDDGRGDWPEEGGGGAGHVVEQRIGRSSRAMERYERLGGETPRERRYVAPAAGAESWSPEEAWLGAMWSWDQLVLGKGEEGP